MEEHQGETKTARKDGAQIAKRWEHTVAKTATHWKQIETKDPNGTSPAWITKANNRVNQENDELRGRTMGVHKIGRISNKDNVDQSNQCRVLRNVVNAHGKSSQQIFFRVIRDTKGPHAATKMRSALNTRENQPTGDTHCTQATTAKQESNGNNRLYKEHSVHGPDRKIHGGVNPRQQVHYGYL